MNDMNVKKFIFKLYVCLFFLVISKIKCGWNWGCFIVSEVYDVR